LPAATASPTALPANVIGLGISGRATPTGVGSVDSIGSVSTTPVHSSSIRPASPSPSLASSDRGGGGVEGESAGERSEKEEEDRRRRQQLYVFVMRCIAYPFNAKQPTDMARRQVKVNRSQLATIRERFQVMPFRDISYNAFCVRYFVFWAYYQCFISFFFATCCVRLAYINKR